MRSLKFRRRVTRAAVVGVVTMGLAVGAVGAASADTSSTATPTQAPSGTATTAPIASPSASTTPTVSTPATTPTTSAAAPSAAPSATSTAATSGATTLGPANSRTKQLWSMLSAKLATHPFTAPAGRNGGGTKPVMPGGAAGGSVTPDLVNGTPVDISAAPYTVMVVSVVGDGSVFCGGTLIAPNKVLTAAHCLAMEGVDAETETYVAGGITTLSQFGSGAGTLTRVLSSWTDPDFSVDANGGTHNDLAVLTLDASMPYTTLPTATSADSALYAAGTAAQVYGWGLTAAGGSLSPSLETATLNVASDTVCAGGFPSYNATQSMCTGPNTASTCNGDSGGPLVVNNHLIGIVGFGSLTCSGYDYFTRVSTYAATIGSVPTASPQVKWEAEDTPISAASATLANQLYLQANCCGAVWSGGYQVFADNQAAGGYVTFEAEVGAPGSYDLSAVLTQAPDYGSGIVTVNGGGQLGPIFEGYNTRVGTVNDDFGPVYISAAGPVEITFSVLGRNFASSNYRLGVDSLTLAPLGSAVSVEGESGTGTSNVSAAPQGDCCGVLWSGNSQLLVNATAAGAYVDYTLPASTVTGDYDLKALLTRASDYGQIALFVDGVRTGPLFDGYASTVQAGVQDFGPVHVHAGSVIRFLVATKDPWAAGYLAGIDRFDLTPLGTAVTVEGENTAPMSGSAPTGNQFDAFGAFFSGDYQLWVNSTAAGQQITFPVTVPTTGDYDVAADLTRAGDFGQFIIGVDYTRTGPIFDGYSAAVRTTTQDFGTLHLTAGRHVVTLLVIGRNASSGGYRMGLDRLRLTGHTAAPTQEAETAPLNSAYNVNLATNNQPNCCGVLWSFDTQKWFGPQQVWLDQSQGVRDPDRIAFVLNVPTTGTYDLSALMTQAPDFGMEWFTIDGTDIGGVYDAYAPGVRISPYDLGRVTLSAGQHTLEVTVGYGNSAASGDGAGIDSFRLTAVS